MATRKTTSGLVLFTAALFVAVTGSYVARKIFAEQGRGGPHLYTGNEISSMRDVPMDSVLKELQPLAGDGDHPSLAREASQIAREFASASPPSTQPAQDSELWFGRAIAIARDMSASESWFLLRIHPEPGSAPAAAAKSGAHPERGPAARVYFNTLKTDGVQEDSEAQLLIQELSAGKSPGDLRILRYLRTAPETSERLPLQQTDGTSAAFVSRHPHYLRAAGSRLLLLAIPRDQAEGAAQISGSGTYAVLYRVP